MAPQKTKRSWLARLILLVLVAGGVLGFAIYQGHAIVGRAQRGYGVRSGRAVVPPIDGARFVRSYPVRYNGQSTQFAHYVSRLPAERVVAAYRRRAGRDAEAAPAQRLPGLTADGAGCSTFSYVTDDGRAVGVVAFDNRQTGGSEYFVGAMPADSAHGDGADDCPGREPPGVPKPSFSRRTLCIENLGGADSVLAGYEAWGRPSGIVADFRRGMAENGWTERTDSSRVLTVNYQGIALLCFARGHEQCLIGIDQVARSGKIVVLVFWADRPWLPRGQAL
ncbi:MAG: hypothetical protein ACOC8E_07045 [Planctomycetota bacterium]